MATAALRAAGPSLRPYNLMSSTAQGKTREGLVGRDGGTIAGGKGRAPKGPPADRPGESAAKQESRGRPVRADLQTR